MTKLAIKKRILVFPVGKGHASKPPTFNHYVSCTRILGGSGYDKGYDHQHYKEYD